MKASNSRVSRRGFGRMLAGSAAAGAAARAQVPSREEDLRAAQKRREAAAETLAKFDLPSAVEPAFVFRP